MKTLFKSILLGLLIAQTASGSAIQGQNATSNLYGKSFLQVPVNQATDLGANKALIETGNKNLLINASFEHKVFDTNWTLLGSATDAVETTTIIDGVKAAKINITASGDGITQSLTPGVNTLNQQMEASCKVNTSMTNIQLCATAGGVEQSCQSVPATGSYQAVSANFQGPVNGTAVGVKIKSTSAGTGAVYADDCFVGPARNLSQVSQAQLLGTVTITGCAGSWSNSGTTYADFSAQTGCVYTATGLAQAPSTMIPAIKLSSTGPGELVLQYEGRVQTNGSGNDSYLQFWDGTNTAREQSYPANQSGAGNATASSGINQSISYTTAQSNVTLSIRAKNGSGGSVALYGTTANPAVIKVYYFPSQSQTAFTSANNVASWSGYLNLTSGGWSTTSTTFADFSAAAGTALTQIQNRNFGTVTAASSLIPGITFTPPKSGNYFVCATPTLFNAGTTGVTIGQVQLTDGTTLISNGEIRNNASNNSNGGATIPLCGIYNAASTSPVTLKLQGLTTNASFSVGIGTSGGSAKNIMWSIAALDGMGGPVILPATASSGATNYLTGGDGESGANVCTPYADAAGVAPVTGSGGSPTVTCALSSASPISGTQSYVLTKPASNVQGQGWSFPFTVDAAAQAKMLQVSFDYQVDSNYTVGSDTATPDMVAYVYGPTDGTPQLTQLTPYKALGGSGTLKFQGNLQTAASGKAYRLLLHEPNTGTLASTIKVDNIVVSPVLRQFGAPITDTQSYSITLDNVGTPSQNSASGLRYGDRLKITGQFVPGAVPSSTFAINLPNNLSIDISKFGNSPKKVGTIRRIFDSNAFPSTSQGPWDLWVDPTVPAKIFGNAAAASGNYAKQNSDNYSTTNVTVYEFDVPIQGWSSSTQMSDQSGDNRIITARATLDATPWNVANNTTTLVTFDDSTVAPNFDPVGAYNSSTGKYTFNSAGYYHVYSYIQTASATGNGIIWVYKNGAIDSWGDYSAGSYMYGFKVDTIVKAVAGDYIQIYFNQNSGGNVNIGGGRSYFTVQKLQGNQQIVASESVNARYHISSSSALTQNSEVVVKYDAKDWDTHGSYNPSTGIYTAPSPGVYQVNVTCAINASGGRLVVDLYKNGSKDFSGQDGTITGSNTQIASGLIKANQGDQIAGYAFTSLASNSCVGGSYISFARVGN